MSFSASYEWPFSEASPFLGGAFSLATGGAFQLSFSPDPRKTLNRHDAKAAKDTIFPALDRRT
jgi:hypothetical protein